MKNILIFILPKKILQNYFFVLIYQYKTDKKLDLFSLPGFCKHGWKPDAE